MCANMTCVTVSVSVKCANVTCVNVSENMCGNVTCGDVSVKCANVTCVNVSVKTICVVM